MFVKFNIIDNKLKVWKKSIDSYFFSIYIFLCMHKNLCKSYLSILSLYDALGSELFVVALFDRYF